MSKENKAWFRMPVLLSLLAAIVAAAAVSLAIVIELDSSYPSILTATHIFDVAMIFIFTGVGGLLIVRKPANLVGWAIFVSGFGLLSGGFMGGAYAELAVLARPEANLPLGLEAAVISEGSWVPLMAGVFFLLLLFPTGRVPSPRWKPIALAVLAGFALVWAAISTGSGSLEPPFENYENPMALTESDGYWGVVIVLIAFCLSAIAAAAVDLFVRFRRSRGQEREQFKWLAFSAGVLAFSIPFSGTAGLGIVAAVADVTFGLGLVGLPVAVGIAILKHNLYDIDRIINRTLTYGLLTAGLAAIYLGLVVGLQALLRPVAGSDDYAIVVTTLVVAALFLPARRRVQDAVDRRFNRRTYDAARTIDAFSARLRQQIDLDTLRYELLAVVDETMQPARAMLWLRNRNDPGTP